MLVQQSDVHDGLSLFKKVPGLQTLGYDNF